MAFENVKELLKAVKTDPEAKKALQGLEKPADEEGVVGYYVEAAKRLGFEVTEADIRKAVADLTQKQEAKTEEAAGKIKAVADDELDQVAGGNSVFVSGANGKSGCRSTYTDRENCWNNDGCDSIHNYYEAYRCESNLKEHVCGAKDTLDCSSVLF